MTDDSSHSTLHRLFLKQVIQHKHVSKIWTWPDLTSPDLARLGVFKVGPRPDLAQWARRHCDDELVSILSAKFTVESIAGVGIIVSPRVAFVIILTSLHCHNDFCTAVEWVSEAQLTISQQEYNSLLWTCWQLFHVVYHLYTLSQFSGITNS